MKNFIISITLLLSINSFGQTYGFFTIDVNTDNLVLIDTLGNETIVGPVGRDFEWDCISLEFFQDTLYCIFQDTLFNININTGTAYPLRKIYDVNNTTNPMWGMGMLAFDSHGHCYFHNEIAAMTQGYLYILDIFTGAATRVSNNLSGNASILGIEFDKTNNTLYAASEYSDRLMIYDTLNGTVSYATGNTMGAPSAGSMEYDNNNILYVWDNVNINNAKTLKKIDITTGVAETVFSFNSDYGGLAFYDNMCTYYDTTYVTVYDSISVTDTLIINANITNYNPVIFNNTIKIYPNPASDHIYIDVDDNSMGYEIKIINTLSQVVFETTLSQSQYNIDLNSWTGNGTYFVQFYNTDGNLIEVKKIIIQ